MTTSKRHAFFAMSLTALVACVPVPGATVPQDGEATQPSGAIPTAPPKVLIKFNPDYIARIMAEKAKPANSARILELKQDGKPSAFAIVGHGHNVAFDSAGFELSYVSGTADDGSPITESVSVRFEGAKPGLTGRGQLPSASATHTLRDGRFSRDVPAFGAVRFEEVYPHIDLYYLDTNDQFTFMFVVQPGGNPDVIRINVDGDDGTIINGDGALIVSKHGRSMSISAPFTYQETPSGKNVIESEFAESSDGMNLTAQDSFQFGLGRYEDHNALIIDPTVDFVSMLGNSSNTRLTSAGDGGDVFVAGPSADFAPNAGVFYIARHDGKTGALLNQTLLFGGRGDMVRDIYAHGGKLYLTGYASADLLDLSSVSPPAVQPQRAGATDAFALVMDGPTLAPVYGTYFGGSQRDYGIGIRADDLGHILFAGYTDSSNFPLRQTAASNFDAFAVKIRPATGGIGDVIYSRTLGGSSVENINDISIDRDGNLYMLGRTSSADLPRVNPLAVSYQPTSAGFNPFLWKLSPGGDTLFATYAHANDISTGSYASALDTSPDGNTIAFGGSVMGSNNQLRGYLMKLTRTSPDDAYEALYTHTPVGAGSVVYDVALDSAGTVYAVGEAGDDFTVTDPTDGVSGTSALIYVLKDTNGVPEAVFSKRFGGSGVDRASALVVDRKTHNILLAGSTNSPTFTGLTGGTLISGAERGFLMRLTAIVPPQTPPDSPSSGGDGGSGDDPEQPPQENRPPLAALSRGGSLTIKAATLSVAPNTLNLKSSGQWILAVIKKDNSALAAVDLDARGSTDPDGDDLSYRMVVTGAGLTIEKTDPLSTFSLPPGSFDATLTVCDNHNACASATATFKVARADFSKVNPQDLKLNGVAADWLIYFGGNITAKFSKNFFKHTVNAGQNVPVVLSGALDGLDHIKVLDP